MVMDIMSSEFETGEFDCIIDKGTLDSILVIFIIGITKTSVEIVQR